MKTRDSSRHPGPWRVMKVDSESAGILIAIAFVALLVVGLPMGKFFIAGAIVFGGLAAVGLRLFRK